MKPATVTRHDGCLPPALLQVQLDYIDGWLLSVWYRQEHCIQINAPADTWGAFRTGLVFMLANEHQFDPAHAEQVVLLLLRRFGEANTPARERPTLTRRDRGTVH